MTLHSKTVLTATLPLADINVLVTRPEPQATELCQLITQQGGSAIRLPTLVITASDNLDEIQNTLARIEQFQWLVFISANAVNFALLANGGKIAHENNVRFIAIGQATAQALQQAGLPVHVLPEHGYNSEALLAMPVLQEIAGQRFLIVRGDGGREHLADTLRERGAEVHYLTVYRRVLPELNVSAIIDLLKQHALQVITITSGESLQNLLTLLGETPLAVLQSLPLVVISERLKQLAINMGFKQIAVSASPANSAILETIIIVTGKRRDRIE